MKKITITLFLISSIIASAQLQKRNLLLGGGFGFTTAKLKSSDSNASTRISNGSISPKIGWFLTSHSAVGFEPGYSFIKDKSTEPPYFPLTKRTVSIVSIMPFYRHYFPLGEKAAFYLHGRAGGSFKNTKEYHEQMNGVGEFVSISRKLNAVSGGAYISPGFALFITPKFSIEAMISTLSYEYTKNNPQEGENYNRGNFNFTVNTFTFGTIWYLGKK